MLLAYDGNLCVLPEAMLARSITFWIVTAHRSRSSQTVRIGKPVRTGRDWQSEVIFEGEIPWRTLAFGANARQALFLAGVLARSVFATSRCVGRDGRAFRCRLSPKDRRVGFGSGAVVDTPEGNGDLDCLRPVRRCKNGPPLGLAAAVLGGISIVSGRVAVRGVV